MKKYFFAVALLAMGFSFTACNDDEETTIPEGTTEVTIEEDDTEVTSANLTNWTQYSVQVANLLTSDATSLLKAWKEDYQGNGSYAETFKNPSATNSTFKSYSECVEEIVTGCADIANEVGTAKIGEPRDLWESGKYTEAVYAVESWYSFHSIDDYSNNILSIRNAFMGTRTGSQATYSLAAYLQENNNALYESVKTKITVAYESIQSMAAPFRSHIGNSSVLVAMNACAALESTLRNELLPAVTDIPEADLKPIIENYVDAVVMPTYEALVSKNTALNTAIRTLANTPSDANFETAANAWMAAREPWETSEAFLFGPVADLGLDPNMDSWPLDVAQLTQTLNNGSFQDLEWEGEFDEDDEVIAAAQGVRGFHTLEFLLFKNGEPRTIK